jgi:hypothetical protein
MVHNLWPELADGRHFRDGVIGGDATPSVSIMHLEALPDGPEQRRSDGLSGKDAVAPR